MDTKGNKVLYKGQEVKFNLTDGYYFIDTDQGMLKLEYHPDEDRWYEGLTVKQSCQYKEVSPAFIMAYGPWFLRLQNPKYKSTVKSLKILRNLNADCVHVQYKHDTSNPEINEQVKVLHDFCQALSPETLDFFNEAIEQLSYTVAPFNGSTFVNEFFLEVLMDTFEEGTNEDWYDVDNFIHDVMDKFEVCSGAEAQVRFQDALIDFVREIEPYEHFGSTGLFIIVSELTEWASHNF